MVDFCRVVNPGFGYLRDRKGAFTSFEFPGAKLTIVFDINNHGQMVGTYVDAAGSTPGGFTHGFLLEDGIFTTIDFPGPSETEILGINDRGQMVGTYIDAQGIIHGFLFSDGVFTTIDSPDAAMETVLFGINDRGQILGGFVDAGGMRRSCLLEDGVFTNFVPGASRTAGFDIDDGGRVVGFYVDGLGPGHGFLLDQGVFTTIDIPGDSGTMPTQITGINKRGLMTGIYLISISPLTPQGFLMDKKGVVTPINHPDAPPEFPGATVLLGIDEHGQIVGAVITGLP
jgi:probable HAF family extracellular repeat protein